MCVLASINTLTFKISTAYQSVLSTLWIATVCIYSQFSHAQQVPIDLPNEQAIEAYALYLSKAHYSAFAVSREGTFGMAWSWGVIASAESAAIEDCEISAPTSPCFVVSIDGESLQETIEVSALIDRLIAQRQRVWPTVEKATVPIQIAANKPQINAYQQYLEINGHKALAVARDGSWGIGGQKSNDEKAVKAALEECHSKAKNPKNCKIIDQNNRAVLGRVAVQVGEIDRDLDLPLPELMPSDLASKKKAMPLFKDRWEEYQEAERHKAFAINNFGAMGMAKEHASALVAEEAALSSCESYNDIRRNSLLHSHKVAPCFIIATNNFFDTDNIDKVAAQKKQLLSED